MNKVAGVSRPSGLLGKGVYDVVDVAKILRRDPYTVARWTQGEDPLYHLPDSPLFCFLDVISLYVISELRRNHVSFEKIRRGSEYLNKKLDTPYPFAHQRLGTAGQAFFAEMEEWIDVGKYGQRAFQAMVQEALQPIKYGLGGLAAVWRPVSGVWINPLVQAGAPCIDGTRVPTQVVAALRAAGESPADIAEDLALDVSQINVAIEYEEAA
jgi:uncharacterized protein (DUF433 family)